jgi:hypothetical protein
MTEPDNVVLQHLRGIREQLDKFDERQLEMIQRLGNLGVRVDRIDARLDRVERRLGSMAA